MKLTPEQVRSLDAAPSRQLYALHFASLGIKVFPLRPGLKVPADVGWADLATSDSSTINAWFETRPNMNYGIACGKSGLLVVDLDTKNDVDGIANWNYLSGHLGPIETFEVETPNGGKHLYFWGGDMRNSAGTIGPGIDLRATGGYVVGPGSRISEGMYSSGFPWHFPDTGEIATASEALMILLKSRKGSQSLGQDGVLTAPRVPVSTQVTRTNYVDFGRSLLNLVSAEPGTRNDTLYSSAFTLGGLVRAGVLQRETVDKTLLSLASQLGLSTSEILGTIESGLKSGIEKSEITQPESKYEAMDISAWLNGEHSEPELFGSGTVLYRPALIAVMGEPASGKSFLCLNWAIDVMLQGQNVVWLDEEAGPRDTLNKLQDLGADVDLLERRFKYLKPNARHLMNEAEDFRDFVIQNAPGLIVIDSAAAVIANAGLNENDNSPVGAFMNKALLPLVKDLEITTLIIDHKTKNNLSSGYARGASSKLGVVDLALNVEVKNSFSKQQSGAIEVKVNKDRTGIHQKDCAWPVTLDVANGHLTVKFGEPKNREVKSGTSTDKVKNELIEFVKSNPGASKSQVESGIQGAGTSKKREVLRNLVDAGLLSEKRIGNRFGFWITPNADLS